MDDLTMTSATDSQGKERPAKEPRPEQARLLAGMRVAFLGRLAGMSKRDAARLVREHGGVVSDVGKPGLTLVVIGEEKWPLDESDHPENLLGTENRAALDQQRLQMITETQLWQRMGLVEIEQHIHRLYTPAMLANMLDVPVAVIRRWHRKGLIVPAREVRRLPYFDFQEVAAARRLADLLAAGVSPTAIERKLAELARYLPGVSRPLAQLSVIVQGKQLLLRQGDGLVEPGGQFRFDFDHQDLDGRTVDSRDELVAPEESTEESTEDHEARNGVLALPVASDEPLSSPEDLLERAVDLEDDGQIEAAIEMVRSALLAIGSSPEVCFQLAELLYRLGDPRAARERYYMAIELDESYVEARANLGCVLAELDQRELAVAAFEGALTFHYDYPDVHYHLARTLDELERPEDAETHWQDFLQLAPDSPWAVEARDRLGIHAV